MWDFMTSIHHNAAIAPDGAYGRQLKKLPGPDQLLQRGADMYLRIVAFGTRLILFFLPAFLMACGSAVVAQEVPLIAKVREKSTVTVEGKVEREVKEGHFYRSSNGSTLYIWLDVKGKTMKPTFGQLIDNSNLALYNLDYGRMEAVEKHKLPKPAVIASKAVKDFGLGEDVIEGVACKNVPIYGVSGNRKELTGVACTIEPGIALRSKSKFEHMGHIYEEESEMYDIRIGEEPDPELFKIEKKFKVFKPSLPDGQAH
jgi:hypothetical protein